jgi:RNA polymerase sigma-70 factor (ECF subfamily)
VQAGDEEAARSLAERLYTTIIKSVRSHLPRRTSEEDLVQAVYVKVFSKLSQFSGLVPLEHWVSRIAINTCINQLKHETVRPELRMGDLNEEEEAVVQHLATTHEDLPGERCHAARELLDKLMARLKPEERLVIRMVHLEERSTEEVSRLTGWSISLVKVKAFRARQKMRKLWKTLLNGER